MPYSSIDDLPASVQPSAAACAEIYAGAFNGAWNEYAWEGPEQREKSAHRVAWAAVKRKFVKLGDSWIARGD
jgi:cation transport regulator